MSLDELSKLDVVMVTTQKRQQPLQDVPITVNTLSGEFLKHYAIDDLFDAANLVPGMVFSRAPDDGLGLTLRGLGTPARTQSFDQSVALFLDGMFIGKGRMYSSSLFDIQRIEVIKGTQSTLLGKNSSLGALSVITNKPGNTLKGAITLDNEFETGGNTLDGAFDIPVFADLAVRIATHYVDEQGWVNNKLTAKNVPADKNIGIRVSSVYAPSSTLIVTFSYQYTDDERRGNGFQFVDNGGYFTEDALAIVGEVTLDNTKAAICPECPGLESFHDTEVDSYNLVVEKDMGSHQLTAISSFASYDLEFHDDFDFGNAFDEVSNQIINPGTVDLYSTYFQRNENYEQLSQELRMTSLFSGDIEYMLGVFYFDSHWNSNEQQHFSTPNFPPDPAITGEIFNGSFTNQFSQDTQNVSTFAQLTLKISDQLRSTMGLRYTDEKKHITFTRVQGTPQTLWNTVQNPPFSAPLKFKDSFISGNINLQYQVKDTIMYYGAYSLGSKTGGYAESAEVVSANPALSVDLDGAKVKTEEATTIELGVKANLFSNTANLNIAVFNTRIKDFQETSFQVTGQSAKFLTRNINAESKGVDFSTQWQVSKALNISAGFCYADAINRNDGSQLAQAPRVTGNMSARYERMLPNGMVFTSSGFVHHRDKMVSQINETFPSDALTTLDLIFSLTDISEHWSMNLIVSNVSNEISADFSGPPAAPIGALFGAPVGDQGVTSESPSRLRSIKLQVKYSF